jgi:DNA-binding SARP family transcriptional activator
MSMLTVRLFGKMRVLWDGQPLEGVDAGKACELFSYLLLYCDRPHAREVLGGLFWGENPTARSRKYLRHTLWQLQSAFPESLSNGTEAIFSVETDWVQLNSHAGVWVDVHVLENACHSVLGKTGAQFDQLDYTRVRSAVDLYAGDLLTGWYQDWCIYERERLQNAYLTMVDKLIAYCEKHKRYEEGLAYGADILRMDQARERTHRRMMRLYYLAGDRTTALRQYERCEAILRAELSTTPSAKTMDLYQQILADQVNERVISRRRTLTRQPPTSPEIKEVLGRLYRFQNVLGDIQEQLREDINQLEDRLDGVP